MENQQQIVFDEGTEEEAMERQRETELTAFFLHNGEHQLEEDIQPTYIDMPELYRYDKNKKQWIRRKTRSEDTVIGRVHTVNPRLSTCGFCFTTTTAEAKLASST